MVQRIVVELQRRGYLVWFDRKLLSATLYNYVLKLTRVYRAQSSG